MCTQLFQRPKSSIHFLVALLLFVACACTGATFAPRDAGGSQDAGDGGDSGADASSDAAMDASMDASMDAAMDAGPACDAVANTGCTGGLSCLATYDMATTTLSTHCGTPGTVAPQQVCTSDADCVAGALCNKVSSTVKLCMHLCDKGTGSPCDATNGSYCFLTVAGSSTLGGCSDVCSPVTSAECGGGSTCVGAVDATTASPLLIASCGAAGAIGNGGTCQNPVDCGAGLVCLYTAQGSSGVCRKACRPGVAADCTGYGVACNRLATNLTMGGVAYNLCQ